MTTTSPANTDRPVKLTGPKLWNYIFFEEFMHKSAAHKRIADEVMDELYRDLGEEVEGLVNDQLDGGGTPEDIAQMIGARVIYKVRKMQQARLEKSQKRLDVLNGVW